jgi:hypothetical protein
MLPLLNAIYAKFTASPALVAAFPGGLFRDRAPEGTTMPYLVSHVAGSKVQYAYGGIYRTDTEVRFSGYGVGHDATGSALTTLLAGFDDVLLALSSGTNDSVTRSGEPVPVLHRHDSQGNEVWEWSVTYTYSVVL